MKKIIFFGLMLLTTLSAREIGARYLIITHDNFYDAIQPLAQWKHKKGMRTKIVKLSEIGSSSTAIRNYVVNAYTNWQIKPEYLLLVGAPNYLPFGTIGYTSTDNYYTNMDGDIFNEILSGRLTVHNTTEAQNVVNKMLLYEKTPYTNDSSWMIKSCLIVNVDNDPYDDSIYWSDMHQVKDQMLSAGYALVDTLSDAWGNNATSVINSVNAGRGFVLYRGQGVNNWYSPFACNPALCTNGPELPIVLSLTCVTIGTSSTPAAAEMWFLTGTPGTPRAASGYFATTTTIVQGADLRSAVCKGFFDAIFTEGKRTFGEACESGRSNVYNMYANESEYQGHTTIGDPEMNIWTAIPKSIEVFHDSSLNIGAESLHVQVTLEGAPLESALVCVVLDTLIYDYGYTSSTGGITFNFSTLYPGNMTLTVTGQNIIPCEDSVTVLTNTPFLVYQDYNLSDSLANNNGQPESGETVLLRTTIRNDGLVDAYDVSAKLRSDDPWISIIDSIADFGNINSQDSALGVSPFVFSIAPFCPGGHTIDFSLYMNDSIGNSWTGSFSITSQVIGGALGPDQYGYYIYDDTDTLTGNAPVFDWLEIAPPGPGTLVSEITNDDADTVTYALSFNFKYYGVNYDSIGICSNGFAELGYATYRHGDNSTIPSSGGPKRLCAAFWDDLDPSQAGDIYYYRDNTNHRLILEFKNCAHYDNPSLQETFQIILLDPQYYITPTTDGEILYLYEHVADATTNTVGMEDETEARGIQYVYDNTYSLNAAPITTGRALLITTKPPAGTINTPWLYITNYTVSDSSNGNNNGVVEPGETLDIYISIKNSGDTMAVGASGTLRSDDNGIIILDSAATFGDIAIGATADNLNNPYKFYFNTAPADSMIGFVLDLVSNSAHYETQDYFTVHTQGSSSIMEHQLTGENRFGLNVYPNPCRTTVTIKFQIPSTESQIPRPELGSKANPNSQTGLRIYDVTGRLVRDFPISQLTIQPFNQVAWDGSDDLGRKVSEGIYFVRLEAGDDKATKKVIMLK